MHKYTQLLKALIEKDYQFQSFDEDLALCKGDPQKAIKSFKENLEKLRDWVPVNTITMQGSPTCGTIPGICGSIMIINNTIMFTIHPQRWQNNRVLWVQ